ncbi:MAG: hypothetical protein LBO06_04135 [Bacteroidales bacterium]|jgi:hypothetical protein|nr:hypothetical protein [Bacteroidales bacterium]
MCKRRLILLIAALVLAVGCKKEAKFVDTDTGEQKSVKILRFDKALFEKQHSDMGKYLDSIRSEYKDLLFSSELTESLKELAADTVGQMAWKAVCKRYNDLTWLENNITNAFANLQKSYPKTTLPKFYTMIAGPARFEEGFAQRIFAMDSCVVVALDWYSIDEQLNKVYGIPNYMIKVLDSAFLAVDIIKTYLREVTTLDVKLAIENPESDLLSLMVEVGKFDYAVKQLLGCDDATVLRYTKAEYDWCVKNESNIWGFLVENKLLFEKDSFKFRGIINDAPFSKGIEGSPARVAEYIGFNVVSKYVEQSKVSINALLHTTDANKILRESNYKPKK